MRSLPRCFVLLLACCLCACATRVSSGSPTRAVLLVSIDGLRADSVGSGRMPTLDALARAGVQAAWMNPSYPTLTFPNHYTLVTGLRPDRHGIVNNFMQDDALGEYRHKQASARDGRWYGGEPIWATLQRQGGRAATMFWPGSEARIAGQRPRQFRNFDATLPVTARVDQVLAWLDQPPRKRPQLLTLYLEQVDVAAHGSGIGSADAVAAMADVDAALARLLQGLDARGLRASTDVIVVSDHGMLDVPTAQVAYLDEQLPAAAYDVVWWPQVIGLVPRAGQLASVEAAFVGRHAHYACWPKAAGSGAMALRPASARSTDRVPGRCGLAHPDARATGAAAGGQGRAWLCAGRAGDARGVRCRRAVVRRRHPHRRDRQRRCLSVAGAPAAGGSGGA